MREEALGCDGSLFEAVFRVEPPTGVLRAGLVALGIDPRNLAPKYRSTLWVQALALYRAHLFPSLPVAAGNRQLGVALARGYGQTISGALLVATLPLLRPQQLLRQWPRFVRMGRTDVTLEVTETGARSADIHSIDPVGVPAELNLGLLDFAFERMKEVPTYRVEGSGPQDVLVHCAW
jgi:uncharacterized protein (TIGR02265 family)